MDRSFAGRLGLASPARPPARARARRPARSRGGRAGRGGAAQANALDLAIAGLLRLPGLLARALAAVWSYVRVRRRLRIALLAAVPGLGLLGGGWLWLRHSPLVAVEHVRVSGVHGRDARAIEAALSSAAKRMSTLDVSTSRLRAAVASYPVVGGLQVQTSFPHGLRIRVTEQPAVAVLSVAGANLAVAANGTVLGMAQAGQSLPSLSTHEQLTAGEKVREPGLLGALAVLGAAPPSLAKRTDGAYSGSKGLTLVLSGGVRAYFGDASRPHAKWASLARVLADPGSAGAIYVDVRVPERPAAGFAEAPPALEGAQGEAEATTAGGGSESAQSLAEGLTAATGVGSAGGASEPEEASSGEAGSSAETEAGAEAAAPESTESGG